MSGFSGFVERRDLAPNCGNAMGSPVGWAKARTGAPCPPPDNGKHPHTGRHAPGTPSHVRGGASPAALPTLLAGGPAPDRGKHLAADELDRGQDVVLAH